jgi:hypothetical protein
LTITWKSPQLDALRDEVRRGNRRTMWAIILVGAAVVTALLAT